MTARCTSQCLELVSPRGTSISFSLESPDPKWMCLCVKMPLVSRCLTSENCSLGFGEQLCEETTSYDINLQ